MSNRKANTVSKFKHKYNDSLNKILPTKKGKEFNANFVLINIYDHGSSLTIQVKLIALIIDIIKIFSIHITGNISI